MKTQVYFSETPAPSYPMLAKADSGRVYLMHSPGRGVQVHPLVPGTEVKVIPLNAAVLTPLTGKFCMENE